jgi:hypothetical protein
MINNIDVDRLHKVLTGEYDSRGSGRTFAMLVIAIQTAMADVGYNRNFGVVFDSRAMSNFYRVMACEIAMLLNDKNDLKSSKTYQTIHINSGKFVSKLYFMTVELAQNNNYRGIGFDTIFVDHQTFDKYDEEDFTIFNQLIKPQFKG